MHLRAILCVDDQRIAHTIEEEVLAPYVLEGSRIIHAYDGLQALRALVDHPEVDLVLLDINMPVMNGLAFLEQKQRTQFAAIPVIVVTSEGERRDEAEHAITLGATRVLSKPFGYQELDACVRSIFVDFLEAESP